MRRNEDQRKACEVTDRRQHVQRAHTDGVHQRAADENGDGEGPERRAEDQPQLLVRQLECGTHGQCDVAANGKHHRRGDQRDTARDEELLSVHDVGQLSTNAYSVSPTAIRTCCRPLTRYVCGALDGLPIRECHSGVPLLALNATKFPLPSPVKITPPAVVSSPPLPPPMNGWRQVTRPVL